MYSMYIVFRAVFTDAKKFVSSKSRILSSGIKYSVFERFSEKLVEH